MEYPQYDPSIDHPPLDDAELAALDELLETLPADGAMNIEALDGYLTALVAGPPVLAKLRTAEWLPAVWGGDGPEGAPFASGKQRKRATMLVLRHLHAIDRQLRTDPAQWEPVVSVAEAEGEELVDAEIWCAGFLAAVDLDADAWAEVFDDEALGAALMPLVLMGADEADLPPEEAERLDDPLHRDALSRAAVDAVLLVHRHFHPESRPQSGPQAETPQAEA